MVQIVASRLMHQVSNSPFNQDSDDAENQIAEPSVGLSQDGNLESPMDHQNLKPMNKDS